MSNQPMNMAALRGAVDLSSLARPATPPTGGGAAPAGAGGSSYVIDVDDRTFNDAAQRSMQVPVVLVLWSSARPETRKHVDTLAGIVNGYEGRLLLACADVDKALQLRQALQVQQVPMVIAIVGGQPLPLYVGDQPAETVRDVLGQVLQAAAQAGVTGRVEGAPAAGEQDTDDAAAQPQEELSPHHQAAFAAIESGDYAAAITAYDQALAADPSDEEARLARGQVVLLQRTQGVDIDTARAEAAAAPGDVTKQTLVADLDLLGGHVEDAFTRLIDLVRTTGGDDRNAAREHLIGLFDVVGANDPRVKKARTALMSALY